MNITAEISTRFDNDISELIAANKEIQFYYNFNTDANIDCFRFKDSRFEHTASEWRNGCYETENKLIVAFEKHIENVTITQQDKNLSEWLQSQQQQE